MASDGDDNGSGGSGDGGGRESSSHEPRECMACRGTGQVISNLGGAASKLTCPWCEGQGVRLPGIDAQARWAAQGAEATAPAPSQAPEPAA